MKNDARLLFVALFGICACTVEAADHPRYGQTCASPDASYRGYCLNAGDGGGLATIESGVMGLDGGESPTGGKSSTNPQPRAGSGASAGRGSGSSGSGSAGSGAARGGSGGESGLAGSGAPMCDPAAQDCGAAGTGAPPGCIPTAATEPTACNGVDEDCDGHVDELVKVACYDGAQGCMADGSAGYRCTGSCRPGFATCAQGAPGPCDGQVVAERELCAEGGALASDEDCDGHIDEGCACTAPDQPCYSGPSGTRDVGPCRAGIRSCESSGGACAGEVLPQTESCANSGADDDCDGEADDVPGMGEPCTAPAMGRCAAGRSRCEGDRLRCAAGAPREEQCDSTDDDCDGKTDETFDLPNSEQNCGRCGRACGAGQTCCDGSCVNLSENEDHCGVCGNACGAGLGCCGGTCFNLASDQNNCGSCGNACGLLNGCCRGGCRLLSLGC